MSTSHRVAPSATLRLLSNRGSYGIALTVEIRRDHAVAFVTARDPRGDGRPPHALGAFRVDLAAGETIGLPRQRLVELVARRLATASADWAHAELAGGPGTPGGGHGGGSIPGQLELDLDQVFD